MHTAIEGVYENGMVTLSEPPPTTDKTEVVVIFPGKKNQQNASDRPRKGVRLGSLEGKISISNDFNEPLEDFADYM